MSDNLYDLLNVKSTDTTETIKKAYRKKIKTLHPDHGGDPDEFTKIKKAYDILSTPDKRAKYDNGEPIDDEINDLDHHIKLTLLKFFTKFALEKNVIESINDEIDGSIQMIDLRVMQINDAIESHSQQIEKLYRKDDQPNLFNSMILQKINELKSELDHIEKSKNIAKLTLNELAKYHEKNTKKKTENNWMTMSDKRKRKG
jgi:curved DNA-binding protein CbpA